uniref:Uncharacterized protein n=1 Tax=Glossina morsitans morsitans TaxID=37546 RepID=A0A1B0GEH2_GLOMM
MKQNGLNSMSLDCSKDSMVETFDFEIWNVVVTAATNTSTYNRRTKVNTDNSDIEIQEEPERPIAREETITKPIPRYDRWQNTDYGWVNKQLVLPFVPPSFPNNSQDGVTHLIKPSEYLKSISDKRSCPSSARSTDTEDYMQIQVTNQHSTTIEPPKPPPPPPLPLTPLTHHNTIQNNDRHHNSKSINTHTQSHHTDTTIRKQHQPLSAISIQDLNSVQLRRTDTQKIPKPYQMPARSLSMQCLSSTTDTYLKSDLIAELKISKDIPGIKKMKVEKQMANRFDSEHYSEITKQFTASNYVDQIPERDQAGNIIPDWKRQMMAKKAAEKAKKEFEERMAKEAENRRLSQIPQWKRDLLARREETENKLKATIYTPKVEENNRIADTWRLKNRAMSIDNISMPTYSLAI